MLIVACWGRRLLCGVCLLVVTCFGVLPYLPCPLGCGVPFVLELNCTAAGVGISWCRAHGSQERPWTKNSSDHWNHCHISSFCLSLLLTLSMVYLSQFFWKPFQETPAQTSCLFCRTPPLPNPSALGLFLSMQSSCTPVR